MSHITRSALSGLILLLAHSVSADTGQHNSGKTGLDADKIQQIQTIGQTVLAAKRLAPADPDISQMRQHMEELRSQVAKLNNQLQRRNYFSVTLVSATGKTLKAEETSVQNTLKKSEDSVRNILVKIHNHRESVSTKVLAENSAEKRHRKEKILSKVQELENEVETVLQSPADEQSAKLQALEKRLNVTKQHTSINDLQEEKTPTISTIVKHR